VVTLGTAVVLAGHHPENHGGLAFGVMTALAMSALRLAVERDPDLPRRRTA